ncbi:hypothetical protein FD723_29050 [Nostoc sp. C052]|uniref:hypothetical protein n=1 Tax=Nostoc sp. C052 TaxID=2576902 RepID=UPI0015C3EFE5|nr:hypothetical protein [Nostoc sp. C052]QLE44091.1 hypothetical protein FD723_29050 [Nostoc sp. C052]
MSSNPCIQAVVETPWYEGEPLWPWSVADYKPFSHIQLYDEMTDLEVGLIFAQLVQYNDLENGGNANDVLYRVIESETLILPGGLQVKSTANELIYPSCCCGLEEWREWLEFLTTGRSPWLTIQAPGLKWWMVLFVYGQMEEWIQQPVDFTLILSNPPSRQN